MKQKFQRVYALAAAREICSLINPACEKLVVAGSLRRMKAEVGDIEIVYIPKLAARANGEDMFAGPVQCDLVDELLARLQLCGVITRRLTARGHETWGAKIKLAVHTRSNVPVDFFLTTQESWFNYLVCRTGPAESNTRIAAMAQKKHWQWKPYSSGFTDEHGNVVPVTSEREVFDFVGLDYNEPKDRR